MDQWDQDFVDSVAPGHITFGSGGRGRLCLGAVEARRLHAELPMSPDGRQ